jgi:hypothetical protein
MAAQANLTTASIVAQEDDQYCGVSGLKLASVLWHRDEERAELTLP